MTTCAGCGHPILADRIEAFGRSWHPQHFCCVHCRRPIQGEFVDDGGQPSHRECWLSRNVPRCKGCGGHITGRYVTSVWGDAYCFNCQQQGACVHCHGAAREKDIEGYPICTTCRNLAVADDTEAANHLGRVAQWMDGLSALGHLRRVPVELTSRARMRKDFGVGPQTLGIARKSEIHQGGRKTVRPERIVVVRGLPRPIFEKVAAHELGHVWVAASGLIDVPTREEEGFCELMSFLWLTERGDLAKDALREAIATSTDPIYGSGFRSAHEVYTRLGLSGVVEALTGRSATSGESQSKTWGMKWLGHRL